MQLGEFLKKEVVDKIMDLTHVQETSLEKKERLERYAKTHFHNVDEMLDYLKKGGTIVPTISNPKCQEGYRMDSDGNIINTEMLYTYFNTPLCVRNQVISEIDFKGLHCFKCKDEGYIMFWKKEEV